MLVLVASYMMSVNALRKIPQKNVAIKLHKSKIRSNFAPQKSRKVAWMSGLVTGLQNRVQRFESASDLPRKAADWQKPVGGFGIYDNRIRFFDIKTKMQLSVL